MWMGAAGWCARQVCGASQRLRLEYDETQVETGKEGAKTGGQRAQSWTESREYYEGMSDWVIKSDGLQHWTCVGCGTECSRKKQRGQQPKWCVECRNLVSWKRPVPYAWLEEREREAERAERQAREHEAE